MEYAPSMQTMPFHTDIDDILPGLLEKKESTTRWDDIKALIALIQWVSQVGASVGPVSTRQISSFISSA